MPPNEALYKQQSIKEVLEMKKFGKGLLIMLGVITGIPIAIILLLVLFGAIGAFVAAPGVMITIILALLIISVPGIIVGILVGRKK